MYKNKLDLMDETLFPRTSIYLTKKNPRNGIPQLSRVDRTDKEIIAAVSDEMKDTLWFGKEAEGKPA